MAAAGSGRLVPSRPSSGSPSPLAQLDASLASAPAREKGRLLVTKALTLERMGETGRAIELLVEAEQTVDRPRNPRLLFIILLNRASFLGRLGRLARPSSCCPRSAALADGLGRGLHQSRLCWLRGSLAAGLGRWEEAESHFQTARRELAYRNKILESALVALELMVLLCRREKAREIRMLAHWIAALVPNPSLSRDARAALRLVCAAEGSEVTLELAERALHLLQRAPKADGAGEPDLPLFAAAGASVVLAGGRQDGSVASTVGIESAAAVRRLATRRGLQEIGGRAPDSADPGDQPVHEAGGLHGAGAGRQGGRGSREANEEGETERETTPSVSASKHENAPSGSATRRGLSWPHRSHHPENTGAENRLVPSPEILPEDFATFVRVLMALRDLTQGELAAATELSPTHGRQLPAGEVHSPPDPARRGTACPRAEGPGLRRRSLSSSRHRGRPRIARWRAG